MRCTAVRALLTVIVCVAPCAAAAQSLASDADRRAAFIHYREGQELLASERFDDAVEAFRTAINYEPLLTDAHYGLGHAYMSLRRYTSAIQAFIGFIEAAKSIHNMRERDRAAGDRLIDEELRELRDTLRRRSNEPLKVTQLEYRISEVERSRSSLGKPFEVPATVLLALGSAHFRLDERDAAEEYWTRAVKINRHLGEGWSNLAVIYMMTGRKKDAEAAVKEAEGTGFRVNPRLKDDIRAMEP